MKNLIKEFANNHNKGLGVLRVAGPYKVRVFDGCGSHYGVVDELEKNTVIYIDRIAPSENSHSTFGHISHIIKNGNISYKETSNWWISLASSNIIPSCYTKPVNSVYNC